MLRLATVAVLLATGFAQGATPVKFVDHVMFTGGVELSGLVTLLRDKFELPVMFDGPAETPPMPGTCFSLGNLCLEVVPVRPEPNEPATRTGGIGNLALAADFATVVDALRARNIEHFPPAPQARWTTIGLRGLGIGFFIEYHDGMERRRTRFRDELERRRGGALGVVRVIEVSKRSQQVADVRPAWRRLLGDPVAGDADVWRVEDGLAIRLVGPDDPRANRLVVAVKSLDAAEAALRRLSIPHQRLDGGVQIDRKALYGLEVMLLQPSRAEQTPDTI